MFTQIFDLKQFELLVEIYIIDKLAKSYPQTEYIFLKNNFCRRLAQWYSSGLQFWEQWFKSQLVSLFFARKNFDLLI